MCKCEIWSHAQGGIVCHAGGTLAMSGCIVRDEAQGGVRFLPGASGTVEGLKTFRNSIFGLQIETADVKLGRGNEVEDAFVCSGAAVTLSTVV